jgi:hypothetical protein
MRNRIGSVTPNGLTVFYAIVAVIVLTNGSARAGNDCLAAPNLDPPQGSHWYYRVDSVQQRHCWYLGPAGQKVRHVEPEVQSTAKSAAPMRTETAGDRLTASTQAEPHLPPPRPAIAADTLAQASVEGIAQGALQGTSAIVQWSDPERAAGGSDRKAGAASTLQDIHANEELARPAAASVANARMIMLIRVTLLVASALAVAGIFQYAVFWIVVKRRRRVYVERGRAERAVSIAREQMPPAFAAPRQNGRKRPPVEQIDPQDIEAGIRQILRAMKRRAA